VTKAVALPPPPPPHTHSKDVELEVEVEADIEGSIYEEEIEDFLSVRTMNSARADCPSSVLVSGAIENRDNNDSNNNGKSRASYGATGGGVKQTVVVTEPPVYIVFGIMELSYKICAYL
jgi:hypothetical protein